MDLKNSIIILLPDVGNSHMQRLQMKKGEKLSEQILDT